MILPPKVWPKTAEILLTLEIAVNTVICFDASINSDITLKFIIINNMEVKEFDNKVIIISNTWLLKNA